MKLSQFLQGNYNIPLDQDIEVPDQIFMVLVTKDLNIMDILEQSCTLELGLSLSSFIEKYKVIIYVSPILTARDKYFYTELNKRDKKTLFWDSTGTLNDLNIRKYQFSKQTMLIDKSLTKVTNFINKRL